MSDPVEDGLTRYRILSPFTPAGGTEGEYVTYADHASALAAAVQAEREACIAETEQIMHQWQARAEQAGLADADGKWGDAMLAAQLQAYEEGQRAAVQAERERIRTGVKALDPVPHAPYVEGYDDPELPLVRVLAVIDGGITRHAQGVHA